MQTNRLFNDEDEDQRLLTSVSRRMSKKTLGYQQAIHNEYKLVI